MKFLKQIIPSAFGAVVFGLTQQVHALSGCDNFDCANITPTTTSCSCGGSESFGEESGVESQCLSTGGDTNDCCYCGVCAEDDTCSVKEDDNTGGIADPHFTTWSKEHFDFQGECDLMLIDNPSFMDYVGMTVHGRTKLHGTWSAFAAAAIKIGDDVLEVHGAAPALINGKEQVVPEIKYGTEYAYPMSIGGYSLTVQHLGPHSRRHIIHFGNGEKMFINNFKEFVDFEVESPRSAEFAGSVGLLGSYNTGKKMARDGKTVIDDADKFGQEWQVIDTDTQLFSVMDGPQYPAKCNMPVKLSAAQRHLRAMTKKVSEDDAKMACAKAPAHRMQNCIADVFGSDNLDMAGVYVH